MTYSAVANLLPRRARADEDAVRDPDEAPVDGFINTPPPAMCLAQPAMDMRDPRQAMEQAHGGGGRGGAHIVAMNHRRVDLAGDGRGTVSGDQKPADPGPGQLDLV